MLKLLNCYSEKSINDIEIEYWNYVLTKFKRYNKKVVKVSEKKCWSVKNYILKVEYLKKFNIFKNF